MTLSTRPVLSRLAVLVVLLGTLVLTPAARANSDLLVLAQNKAADVIAMVEPLASQAEKQGLVVRWKPIAAVAPWYESAQLAARWFERQPENVATAQKERCNARMAVSYEVDCEKTQATGAKPMSKIVVSASNPATRKP